MHAYRFRVLSDENDKFVRDIEIKSTQSFKDFHDILRKVTPIDGNELASFYVCDRKWNKINEITLIDMEDTDLDDDEAVKSEYNIPISVMDESLIKDYIDDPHQRILYEYDILNQGTLYIELLKILPAKQDTPYPLCVAKKGTLNAQDKSKEDFTPEEVDERELLKEFEEMLNGDIESDDFDIFPEE